MYLSKNSDPVQPPAATRLLQEVAATATLVDAMVAIERFAAAADIRISELPEDLAAQLQDILNDKPGADRAAPVAPQQLLRS